MFNYTQNLQQIPGLAPGEFYFNWGRELGAGGLGRVNEVTVTQSNSTHAVGTRLACKRLNNKWKDHPEARERFEREIKALRRMAHQDIITVQAENIVGSGERFYMMPLYPRSLRDFLATKPNGVPWAQAASFVARLADAMTYAHREGFIHRDLKPENILLKEDNSPVIADWGLGYFVHKESKVLQHLTRGGMGTEYYCSMEQWNTGKCEETGDIYSLGVMLAELVRGSQSPIIVGMGIQDDVVSDGTWGGHLLNGIIKKMTHFIPSWRITSMEEVVRQMREAMTYANHRL